MNSRVESLALPGQLAGRTAIVTGASSGIGRTTAALFAGRGARVLAVDLNADGLSELADQVAQPDSFRTFTVDLTEDDAPDRVVHECLDRFGGLDTLANIAGKAGDGPLEDTSDDDLEFFLRVNLGTAFRLSRSAIRNFAESGGAIVNTASTFGLVGVRGSAPYSAAKGAVTSLTRQLAADVGRRNIRVNAVAPGLVATPATQAKIDAGVFDDVVTRSRPLPRVGVPADIANAVAFLASDDAAFITGVTLPVCGGWSTTRFRE
ncbi:SDR family NAD(P)-dependent oxidoreductase [Rhodococcus baikonurensis]|uniref:SDR family NAD(P)-dependent oxidoreductase n=1 Tax=Rhodococcus baikonurensis TaxID=172041 RepID=UPI0037A1E5CE